MPNIALKPYHAVVAAQKSKIKIRRNIQCSRAFLIELSYTATLYILELVCTSLLKS